MSIYRLIFKKLFKTMASFAPGNRIRVMLFRAAGYKIGKNVYMGENIIIIDRLSDKENLIVGNRTAISPGVILITSSRPNFSRIVPFVKTEDGTINIKDDAWVGAGAIILPNVTIGNCAVVGAGAVVNKNIEPYAIVAGVPAKKIGEVRLN